MGFRYKRGLGVEYDLQGYIYFQTRRYNKLPEWEQENIKKLCCSAACENHAALFEFLTTDANGVYITQKYYIAPATLYRAVRKYYRAYAKML